MNAARGLSPFANGVFYRGRRAADAKIPQGSSQCVTGINIVAKGKPHQANIINTYRLRGINYAAKDIFKHALCTVFILIFTLQTSLCDYQGAKRIL